MKKTIVTIASVCVLGGLAVAGFLYYQLFTSPFQITEKSYVYVDTDDNADSVYNKVQMAGETKSMTGYNLMCTLKKYGDHPRTGRYEIEPGVNMFNFVRRLANGLQTPMRLTVPTTRTVDALVGRVSHQLMIDSTALMNEFKDPTKLKALGYTQETLPGLFIPETYEVYWNISPENLVKRFQKEHDGFWNEKRLARAKEMGMTPNEITTLASIVESESNYGPEKPTIAGLYLNRLKTGMKLQSDPTVIFALQDFSIRRVTLAQLAYDSPYNTYRYEGLPPGPIRIATPEGLKAVLNYKDSNYLYMCAKEDFSGQHNFTASYSEHMNNARRYQQALNQRGIRK